ncbi:MAG: type III PLP-dependent enzyme, partial [Candidatus Margulisiibacteriota bacterium]
MINDPYKFPLNRFQSERQFERIREFSKNKPTPFLIIDLDVIRQKYQELKTNLPMATIFYALKANPMDEVVALLHELGSHFDVASRHELDQLLRLGVSPDLISFGNTIKKKADIAYFFERGVRLFVTDSSEDLANIATEAPGSRVFYRILTDGAGSDWPLSRKFGAHPDMIYHLIQEAKTLGIEPFGVSFHVGSQQRDIGQWDEALARSKYLFDAAKELGLQLKMINIGGGFPANYMEQTNPIKVYTTEILRFLSEDFKNNPPLIYMEPGRSIVGDAGIIVSEVIRVSAKTKNSFHRWVFLDIGKFGGLIETMDESIQFPIFFD